MTSSSRHVDGLGEITLRSVKLEEYRPTVRSDYDNWGPTIDPEGAQPAHSEYWYILLNPHHADATAVSEEEVEETPIVGDLSAFPIRHGPTIGSKAMNIGVGVAEEYRGRGIAGFAQEMLAELLHERGIYRVEAMTDVDNVAEQRALKKAGFQLEGVLRGAQV